MLGRLNERGFATLEVILMITVLGILAAVAIPRFSSITASANTAKVQSDLSTLDTAIALYQMDYGKAPSKLGDLSDYIQNISNLKPPSGNAYVDGTETDLSTISSEYTIKTIDNDPRAALGNYTSEDFAKPKSSSSGGSSSGGSNED